jgi:hypothetical protein
MVSSLLAGIRFPSLINEGLDARGTDPNENADPPQKPGRKLIGMPAGFISEWWPASNRNGGRLHVGIPGRNKSESAATLEWVDWFNNRRLLEPIGNIPPAEAEQRYYAMLEHPAMAA